jgi:hypothetical protein
MINARRRFPRAVTGGLALAALACLTGGCRDAEDTLPPPETRTVTTYGQTLDESATPQQVAYVLLRSLAEDVQAAQATPRRAEDQKQANLITWSVAAHNAIEQRILSTAREHAKDPARFQSLGKNRKREIYRVVNWWAPIVAYYVNSFDEDPQTAMSRMNVRTSPNGQVTHIFYEVAPDPSRPDADRRRTLDIELVREKGADGKEYWRVVRVGYLGPGTQPASRPDETQPG